MNADVKIPEFPNTNNEPLWTVEQAVGFLQLPWPLDRKTMAQLGRDCSLAARAMGRPTGVVMVYGKPWPTEKSYTRDVIREAFRLHPATRDYLPKEPQS